MGASHTRTVFVIFSNFLIVCALVGSSAQNTCTDCECGSHKAIGQALLQRDMSHLSSRADVSRMTWRDPVPHIIEVAGPLYEFGVFDGESMHFLHKALPGRFLWGFDSFEGMPESSRDVQQKDFQKGAWHASKTPETLQQELGGSKVAAFVVGFFNETLQPGLAKEMGMQPAAYIDVDVDIYESSLEALDWMFASGLVQKGTLIGYDDWWVNACSKGGESLDPLSMSEGRAHNEIAQKYKVHFQCVAGSCSMQTPTPEAWGPVFKVVGLDVSSPEHGFSMTPEEISQWKLKNGVCKYHHSSSDHELLKPTK